MEKQTTQAPTGLPRSKYRHVTQDEPLWIMFDGGNTDVKAMIHQHWGEEIVFPQAVRQPGEAQYEIIKQPYRHRDANLQGTSIFSARGQGYVVGQQATQVGEGVTIVGPAKYTRDHYGAMLEAALIQLYPASHPDVRIVALHPPALNEENLENLRNSLGGSHKITLADGRAFKYVVTEVITLEEPVAELQCFLLTTEGKLNARPDIELTAGTEILTLDVGGGLTAFVPCIVTEDNRIQPNLTGNDPVDKGIQDVITVFARELRRSFTQLQSLKTIPLEMMHKALMSGLITISNKPFDCQEQVKNAMQAIAYPVGQEYANFFANGVNSAAIVIGGGGGGITLNYFKDKVLKHDFVYPALKDVTKMRFGGIIGASKGHIIYLDMLERQNA